MQDLQAPNWRGGSVELLVYQCRTLNQALLAFGPQVQTCLCYRVEFECRQLEAGKAGPQLETICHPIG